LHYVCVLCRRLAAALLLLIAFNPTAVANIGAAAQAKRASFGESIPNLSLFLDRLMMAESGGRDTAANPRSSAVGPFQFIRSTFIDVTRRHFPRHVSELTDAQVLELRTSREFARAVAEVFTLENAAYLRAQGLTPSLPNLRLAFLLGASGAAKVLQAQPQRRLSDILEPSVIRANPFMVGMTASGLVAKTIRDIYGRSHVASADAQGTARPDAKQQPTSPVAAAKAAGAPQITVKCNTKLAPCRRWIALQQQKQLKQPKTRDAQQSQKMRDAQQSQKTRDAQQPQKTRDAQKPQKTRDAQTTAGRGKKV